MDHYHRQGISLQLSLLYIQTSVGHIPPPPREVRENSNSLLSSQTQKDLELSIDPHGYTKTMMHVYMSSTWIR